MKKIVSIVLAFAVLCTIFCVNVSATATGRIGDANGDGELTAIDARMILQHIAEVRPLEDTSNLDVNGDNDVTSVDARVILQVVAGIVDDPLKVQQMNMFVDSFNNVKKNAKTATLASAKVYNYNDYFNVDAVFEELYKFATDGNIKDDFMKEFNQESSEPQTFYDDEIAEKFPPIGGTCDLKLSDVSDFKCEEADGYYVVSFKVNGKKNPSRYESVGSVSSIITKEDFEEEISGEDGLPGVSIDCDYQFAVVNAKIEKSTGNMVEYSVDTAMILSVKMGVPATGFDCGIGFAESWEKIKY